MAKDLKRAIYVLQPINSVLIVWTVKINGKLMFRGIKTTMDCRRSNDLTRIISIVALT